MVIALLTAAAAGTLYAAQNLQDDDQPLQCWWRTGVTAVRIGERFTAVLTCATTETGQIAVVVDRSRLEPVAAQFPPFEVLGGTHAPEVVRDGRRFFQYEYTLRLISDAFFNRDVQLTASPITYRVRRTEAGQSAAVEGAAQLYDLPQTAIRIVSVVPDTARDIRDATPATFAALAAAEARANLLVRAGATASVLAAALALVGVFRVAVERRSQDQSAPREVGTAVILRAVARELAAVERDRAGGWDGALVGRALAASRVAAACAIDRPISQHAIDSIRADDGGIEVVAGRLPRRRLRATAAVTPAALRLVEDQAGGNDRRLHQLETLSTVLDSFTQAHYRDEASGRDDSRLDQALADARAAVKKLRVEAGWRGRVRRAVARIGRAARFR